MPEASAIEKGPKASPSIQLPASSAEGRIVQAKYKLTGPICAHGLKYRSTFTLDASGHHDWPVISRAYAFSFSARS